MVAAAEEKGKKKVNGREGDASRTSRSCCFASAQHAARTAQAARSAPDQPPERAAARGVGSDSAQEGGEELGGVTIYSAE